MPKPLSLMLVVALGAIVQPAWAAQTVIYKTDTATMNTSNDWSTVDGQPGNIVPATNFICYITGTLSATNAAALGLGGNIQMDALYFRSSLTGPVTITNDGHTLTLGTSTGTGGFQMQSGIAYDVTIDCPVAIIGNLQNDPFNLQAGRTMTLNGAVSSPGNQGSCLLAYNGQNGTVNLNGGGSLTGTYFGQETGTMNINSNLTVAPTYRFVVGYSGQANPGVMNISNCTVTVASNTELDLSAGYNGVQTSGTGIINIGGTNGAPGKLDLGQTTGTFKIGVATGGAGGSGTLNLNNYGSLSTKRSITANTLAGSANINFNGGTLQLSGAQGSIIGANVVVTMLDGGGTIDTQTNNTTVVPAILAGGTGIGGLTKLGTGTLTLANNSSWGGPTAINGGELVVSTLGFNNSNSIVTVAANATNGVQKIAGGASWACAGLTYTAGNTYLDLNFSAAPGLSSAPLQVNGNLAISGTLNIIVRGTALWAAGTYPLIKYTGTLSGTAPTAALTLPAGVTATIQNNVAHKSIDLNVTVGNGAAAQVVSWAVGSGAWDINTTANWDNADGNPVNYLNGEAALFGDGAAGPSPIAVELDTVVNPAGVTVNNTVMNYTLQGSGSIGGTNALVKSGINGLTMNLANSYSGGTYLNDGMLQIFADNNLGARTGALVMGSALGTTFYSSSADVSMVRPVIITNNATITIDPGTTLSLTNGFSAALASGNVTLNGGGTLDLPSGPGTITNGPIFQINNATVQLDGGTLNTYSKFVVGNLANAISSLNLNAGTFNFTNNYYFTTNTTYTTNGTIITTNLVVATNYNSGWFVMADGSGVNSTLNVSGGAMNFLTAGGQELLLGNRTSGTINVTGGSIYINADPSIYLGGHPLYSINGANGTLNITGPGAVTVAASSQIFTLGVKASGVTSASGTINLVSGGTLTTGRPIVAGNGTSYLHFSGGTLKAGASSTNFLQNLTTADIDGNGGTIDDGGFSVTLTQPLLDNGEGFLTKKGSGTLYLDGVNTYVGATVVTAGTLGGSGTIAGDVTVNPGAALAPGDAGTIGTLTVGGNLALAGNLLISVNTSLAQSNDVVTATGGLTNNGNGSVMVTNLGPTLTVGDQFYLFSRPLTNGNTLTVSGGGATWTNNLALDGSISVLTVLPIVNTNTFSLKSGLSGNSLTLSWPPDRLGWRLLVQTNSLTSGLGTNWFTWPNSTTITNVTMLINAMNGSVFYRMVYP